MGVAKVAGSEGLKVYRFLRRLTDAPILLFFEQERTGARELVSGIRWAGSSGPDHGVLEGILDRMLDAQLVALRFDTGNTHLLRVDLGKLSENAMRKLSSAHTIPRLYLQFASYTCA